MRPQRGKRGGPAPARPVAQFFDFLVPPVVPEQAEGFGSDELADFTQVIRCAESWRELRSLVDAIGKLMDGNRNGEGKDGYATFFIERDGKHLLMGIKANEAGDELHITQQIISRYGVNTTDPVELKMVFDDIAGMR